MVINIKASLPLFFVLSTLFLAFSVSFTLAEDALDTYVSNHHEQQQCQQRCQGSGGQQQRQECQRHCQQQERQLEQCQQRCQKQGHGQQQEECQRSCRQQIEQGGQGQQGQGQEREQLRQVCQQRCKRQGSGGRQQQQHCQSQCEEQLGRQLEQCQQGCQMQGHGQQQQQCRQQCRQQIEHQRGGNEVEDDALSSGDGGAKQRFEQCKQSCERHQQGQGEQEQCPRQCKEQFEQEKQHFKQCQKSCEQQSQGKRECKQRCEQQGQNRHIQREEEEEGQMWGGGQGQSNNPFYFPSHRFQTRFESNEGGFYVLERFSKRQNEVLRGIQNYRLAIVEAKPNTFVLPHHCDAEAIYAVLNGECTCTLLMQDRKESFKMEHGDVVRIPAGATIYLINNNDETLRIAKLIQPVNSPSGRFEEFFPAGSGNPESYFHVFSNEVLESAFNTPRHQLEQGFRQQRGQGCVIRAPREQLEKLSQQASSSRRRGGRQSEGPFNLKQQRPVHSNNYGQFFEARPEQFNQLQDMDVAVSCIDINQQSMMVPHYNSKATYLMMVVEGNGRVEMACPHLASQSQQMRGQQEQEGQSGRYMKVRAQLSSGDVFVVPAGHPVVFVAESDNGNNQNLKILGFGLNAQNNKRNFLAGQEDNIMQQMDREARQLAFGQEMEQIFTKQRESVFVPTQKGRGRSNPLSSILEFAGVI